MELQIAGLNARADGRVPDTLLLLEHPPVITLGRGADPAHMLASPAELTQRGIAVRETSRGGDVTLHAPGQLVGYPILDLNERGRDVHRYLRDLEELLIRALAGWGIAASRLPGLTGVWVHPEGRSGDCGLGTGVLDPCSPSLSDNPQSPIPNPQSPDPPSAIRHRQWEKIAAIGVGVKRWITYHGFALNVDLDLMLYATIIPCGLRRQGVTSVARLLDRPERSDSGAGRSQRGVVTVAEAEGRVADAWSAVFPTRLVEMPRQRWESTISGASSRARTTSTKTRTSVGSH